MTGTYRLKIRLSTTDHNTWHRVVPIANSYNSCTLFWCKLGRPSVFTQAIPQAQAEGRQPHQCPYELVMWWDHRLGRCPSTWDWGMGCINPLIPLCPDAPNSQTYPTRHKQKKQGSKGWPNAKLGSNTQKRVLFCTDILGNHPFEHLRRLIIGVELENFFPQQSPELGFLQFLGILIPYENLVRHRFI